MLFAIVLESTVVEPYFVLNPNPPTLAELLGSPLVAALPEIVERAIVTSSPYAARAPAAYLPAVLSTDLRIGDDLR